MAPPFIKSIHRTEYLLLGAFATFVFLSAFFHVSDVDVGYHMRTAQHILEGHAIPTKNTFSYTTPDEPWLLHQWLGTLIFYVPYRLGGVTLLIAFKALVATTLMLLIWAAGRLLVGTNSIWPWLTVTLGTLIARIRFFERSDLLSALFCAALFFFDLRFNRNRRWQWLGLPLLVALWANVHAGVIYGVGLLGAFSAAEWLAWIWKQVRTSETDCSLGNRVTEFKELWVRPIGALFAVLAAIISVQLINPNGCKVLWFPISQFASPFWQATILEYQAPTLSHYKLFYLSIVAMAFLQAMMWRRLQPRLLLASLLFGFLACRSQRSILFFVITAMPHLALMLRQLQDRFKFAPLGENGQERTARLAAWAAKSSGICSRIGFPLLPFGWAAIVLGVFVPDPSFVFGAGFYHPYYPLEVYSFIQAEVPPQNIFNEMRYGGSMSWWLYPRFKPFIDGRGDAFSEEFWTKEYFPVIRDKPGWQETLRRHNVTGALLPIYEDRTIPPLAKELCGDPDWALVAFNDETLLFLQRTSTNQGIIERHEFREIRPDDWSLAALDSVDKRAKATAEARRAFELSPESSFAQTALARAYMVNGEYAPAAAILRRFAADKTAGENYLRDFGYALFRLGQFKEADAVFGRMIRQGFLPGFAWYMRYFIAVQEGQPAAAHEFLSQAMKAEPTNAEYREAFNRLTPSIR